MFQFRKHLKPIIGARSPHLRNLDLRPTRLGIGLLVTVVLLWLVGLNYQVNLAYAAAFWLLGFGMVSMLMNVRQLLGMEIDVCMQSEVFAGGEAVLTLSAPDQRRERWLWACNEDHYLAKPNDTDLWHAWEVRSGSLNEFVWRVPSLMRGYLRVPPLRTASIAPFGMCMVQCVWHWPSDAVVFPAPMAHDTPNSAHPNHDADRRRPSLEGGDELAYLKAHQEGASLQHVAWKTFAKTGELLDKRFETQQAALHSTLISYRDYPTGTPTERLASLLCYRILEAERQKKPYVLELPQRDIKPQNGQREIALTALGLW